MRNNWIDSSFCYVLINSISNVHLSLKFFMLSEFPSMLARKVSHIVKIFLLLLHGNYHLVKFVFPVFH